MNKIVVLTDIHGNLSALEAVMNDISIHYQPEGIAFLGDLINYGVRPNEVIGMIANTNLPVICSLTGNHELAVLEDKADKFSTERGKESFEYTKTLLNQHSLSYLCNDMNRAGKAELCLNGKNILFIHGDMDDPHWGKLTVEKTTDLRYATFDYVISGHTHLPHYVEQFYPNNNPDMRNRKKTIFLNPGSVGQPRNHNPYAQYLYLDIDTQTVHHNAVPYPIVQEQRLFPEFINHFYKGRLSTGI